MYAQSQFSSDTDPSVPLWIGGCVLIMFTIYVGIALLVALFGQPTCARRAHSILRELLDLFRLIIVTWGRRP